MGIARRHQVGFSFLELLVAVVLAALIMTATTGLVRNALGIDALVTERNRLQQEARFAMDRMRRAVANAPLLVLPMPDKPDTDWRENVRVQTVPASAPEGSSTLATAVLVVGLGTDVDLDADGFADADNDRDGRIDEDWPADASNDSAAGVYLIDDDGNGTVDDSFFSSDDDERFSFPDEDRLNGVDDDGDGVIDEDPPSDNNGDGAPGLAGIDDDGDGQIDEGDNADDDEDGQSNEDWLDVVVFYLDGDSLIERHPVPWDESGNGQVTGRDFVTSTIAESVSLFRIERPAPSLAGGQLVDLTLELTGPGGATASLSARVRAGGDE